MDIAAITASYEGLKIGKVILSSLFDAKVDAEAKEKVDQVLVKLGDAQDALFMMREELFRLQEENEKLRRRASNAKEWQAIASNYNLEATAGGAVVYVSQSEPPHFACPTCFNKKTLNFLQDLHLISGAFQCTDCQSKYPIKKDQSFNLPMGRRR